MTPFISIIINCYNGEKYLEETLRSVLAQSFTDWELIFWDNCSTDSTPNIVLDYTDDRIHYYRAQEKTTLGKARNLAMEKTLGNYITFIDADDIWLPDFLKYCVETIMAYPETAVVYTRFINFEGEREWLSPGGAKDKKIDLKELISSYGIGMSGAVFSRIIKEDNNIRIDERFSLIEDYDFFIHLGAYGDVRYVSSPQMRYRWNANGLTQNSLWAEEYKMLCKKVESDENLSKYQKRIRKIYDYVRTRDYLQLGKKKDALSIIFLSMWTNPSILRYLYPAVFGLESYHGLRMVVSGRR